MKKPLTWLAIFNIAIAVIFGFEVVAQELGGEEMYLLPDLIDHADCLPEDCNGRVATTGSGATLASGCTFNAQTSTCGGTCYRCDGQNPNGRTYICINVTTDEKCQPDASNAHFTCGTGQAKQCNAAGGDSSLSCCSTNTVTPAATGGACGNNTCLDI